MFRAGRKTRTASSRLDPIARAVVFASLLVVAACQGTLLEPGGGENGTGPGSGPGSGTGGGSGAAPGNGQKPMACSSGEISASPSIMRRLSPDEYVSTARDLLATGNASPRLEAPVGDIIAALEVEKLSLAASELAKLGAHHRFAPCAIDGPADSACALGFIEAFGKLAFRRPIDESERTWLSGVYERLAARTDVTPKFTFREMIDAVTEVILQSPQHVYVHELGVQDTALPAGVRRLTGHERATRLSYLMWGSMPDAELTRAADAGELDALEGLEAQAERLLDDPRARQMIRRLASTWLKLDDTPQHPSLEKLTKDKQRFPLDSPELRSAMRQETEALYERVFFQGEGSFRKLLTTTEAYVNAPLAALYGVAAPAGPDAFGWVTLPADRRAGILTRAAFLTTTGAAEYQSPILRGVFVYRHVLCRSLPDPPADVDNTPPAPSDAAEPRSVRELTTIKTSDSSCGNCHNLVNPIGFALEAFDALGRWQDQELVIFDGQEHRVPVDARATLAAGDLQGEVSGPVELSKRLSDSEMAHDCAVDTWFERALARKPAQTDQCLLDKLRTDFRKSGDLRRLVLAIASSDASLYIKEPPP
jgi:hypothetical protein